MTDREWRATHCIECYQTPHWCTRCGCHESGPAGTEYDPRCETIGVRKTAPDVALTNIEGLTTNDLLGVEMATPHATPLSGSAAANLDGCPNCVTNTEVPYAGFTARNGSTVCLYLCADCGHRWHTSWAEVA